MIDVCLQQAAFMKVSGNYNKNGLVKYLSQILTTDFSQKGFDNTCKTFVDSNLLKGEIIQFYDQILIGIELNQIYSLLDDAQIFESNEDRELTKDKSLLGKGKSIQKL